MNLSKDRSDKRITMVLGLAWIIIFSTGCGGTFKSPDGRVSITVPAGWQKHTFKSKSSLERIGFRNPRQHGWGEVFIENKSDLKDGLTVSGYAETVLKSVAAATTNETRTVSEPTSVTINGYPAVRYEIRATVQNTKFVYLQTFVETPDFFVRVMLWTIPSHHQKNQADFESITASLKQIK